MCAVSQHPFDFLDPDTLHAVLSAVHIPHVVTKSVCKTWKDAVGIASTKTSVHDVVVSISLLHWARSKNCPWTVFTCAAIAETGRADVLQEARVHGCPWDFTTCAVAAKRGHLEVLQFALGHGCPLGHSGGISRLHLICEDAVLFGNLNIIQWLAKTYGPQMNHHTLTHYATRGGHLAVIQWMSLVGMLRVNTYVYDLAAVCGHLHVLMWFHGHAHRYMDTYTCFFAAGAGHLTVLQWLRAHHCPWDAMTYRAARRNGDAKLVEWLRANRCPGSEPSV